jgi:NAD(P)-dependent dehydrogenase (short-subunit alcohol dehydrogenase family)
LALVLADVNEAALAKTAEAFRAQGFAVLTRKADVARDERVKSIAPAAGARTGGAFERRGCRFA